MALAMLLGLASSAAASVREAHFSDGAGTTKGPVDLTELHARYDDAGRLAVAMRFANPLPDSVRLYWAASDWRADRTCGNSVDARVMVSGPAAWGSWQPGYLTVIYDFESVRIAADRKSVKTVVTYEMKGRDFRCVVAGVEGYEEGTSEHIGPIAFDLPLAKLSVRRQVQVGTSFGRPGSTTLRVAATEGAKVKIVVRRDGRRTFARRFKASREGPDLQRFAWTCSRPGTYRFRVSARDAYGKSLVRSGTWTVSKGRCEQLLN